MALRFDNWKLVFLEQRAPGTLQVWAEPFTELRVPKIFNLQDRSVRAGRHHVEHLLRLDDQSRLPGGSGTGVRHGDGVDAAWSSRPGRSRRASPCRQDARQAASRYRELMTDERRDSAGSPFVRVPDGTFRMGSDEHYPEEAPVHRVTVDGFSMRATTVTNERVRGVRRRDRLPDGGRAAARSRRLPGRARREPGRRVRSCSR